MTNAGREIRLGTASLAASGTGPLVDLSRLNVPKYARRPAIAMALVDYMLYVERNTRKALELSAEATSACGFKDWFWKARLGKCYFKLGLLRDAEQQFKSALRDQPHIGTYLELCNVYLRMDLPITALEVLDEASGKFTLEPRLLLGTARVHEMLNDGEKALEYYKKTLALDASCIEAVACLGAHHFYAQQPELATRYYRRLIQMGVNNTEIWNNLGLCLFYAAQYDMSLGCLERALALANDASMADVWYNIGHVGVMLGDLGLSYQAFKVCVSIDPCHGEALNNIGVLEMRRQKTDAARTYFTLTQETNSQLFEPHYNAALMAYREGNFQEAYMQAKEALKLFPDHQDSKELLLQLQKTFALP
jgi:tetratricopeptide repeat protein 8